MSGGKDGGEERNLGDEGQNDESVGNTNPNSSASVINASSASSKPPTASVSSSKPPPASVTSVASISINPSEVSSKITAEQDGSGEESEEENEVLEESPCGRWRKLRSKVSYRDVPGIDCAYLAMDTEEGVEVVWNEATFSETKKFKATEDKLKNVFEALTLIDHPNIVKFHRFWTDLGKANETTGEKAKPRVILITEFMSSGSLKKFLLKTKKFNKKIPLQSWRRWCTQILSALSYLHNCVPAIIHGNLTCDTIFIQHNGLVKIGSVAPDAIHKNVKTFRENSKNFHILAPECAEDNITLTPAIDIFAFGMCALETAALELTTTGEGGTQVLVTPEAVQKSIESLEDELQKDFIRKCLSVDPKHRPKARELLFHPVLFEVHSLKLLAAHSLVKNPGAESMTDEAIHKYYGNNTIMASLNVTEEEKCYRLSDFPVHEKLEKFMEDVKYGIYPLTAFIAQPQQSKTRAPTPESCKSDKASSLEPQDVENRRIQTMQCSIQPSQDKKEPNTLSLRILLRMEDNMNRQLYCTIVRGVDTAPGMAAELVQHGFIHSHDSQAIVEMLAKAMVRYDSEGNEYEIMKQDEFQSIVCA